MTYPQVNPHISDSHVVVYLNRDEYIDARKDARLPDYSVVEYVRWGQVRNTVTVRNDRAAEYITDLMKELK